MYKKITMSHTGFKKYAYKIFTIKETILAKKLVSGQKTKQAN